MSDLYEWVEQMNQILVQKDGQVSFYWWARLKEKFALFTQEVVVVVWGGLSAAVGILLPQNEQNKSVCLPVRRFWFLVMFWKISAWKTGT